MSGLSSFFVPSHVQVYSVALAQAQYRQQQEVREKRQQQQQQHHHHHHHHAAEGDVPSDTASLAGSTKTSRSTSTSTSLSTSTSTAISTSTTASTARTASTDTAMPNSTFASVSSQSTAASSVSHAHSQSHSHSASHSASHSHSHSQSSRSLPVKGPAPAGRAAPPLVEQRDRLWIGDPTSAYPLPCDPHEVARQIIHTESLCECFGGVFCNREFTRRPPRRVLEVACGAAVWTHKCFEYFKARGWDAGAIEFYGTDIVHLAPDLRRHGVNWTFRHADMRTLDIGFPTDFFDFVFIKDVSYIRSPLPEWLELWLRHVTPGGVIEVWETDHVFRSIQPHPPPAPGLPPEYYAQAERTRTYTISASTPWTEAKNRYLADYNRWIRQVFEARGLTTTPCSNVGLSFSTEADGLTDMGSRRLAIPLGVMPWELEPQPDGAPPPPFTDLQMALRTIVLYSTTRMTKSIDGLLAETSQQTPQEWSRWWSQFSAALINVRGITTGECLETGAWWGTKKAADADAAAANADS
ncbi:hypothetical protein KEM52_002236 [Ascosphaera acerosa]|nr:hypothetical protein KEM52_002236 [Ascosphaera acerosa]